MIRAANRAAESADPSQAPHSSIAAASHVPIPSTSSAPRAPASAPARLVVDGIGTWLAAAMDECGAWDGSADATARLAARIAGLVGAWRQTGAYVVAVSDEAGLGVVPATPAGRLFRD